MYLLNQEPFPELPRKERDSLVSVAFLGRDLCFVDVNAPFAALSDVPIADHAGQRLREILPDLAPALEPLLLQTMTTGEPITDMEVRGDTPAVASGKCWRMSCYPTQTYNGTILGVHIVIMMGNASATDGHLISVRDGTARQQAESGLLFYSTVLDHINDAVVAIDPHYCVTYWSPAAERLYGIAAAEALGQPLMSLYTYRWYDSEDEAWAYAALTTTGMWQGENVHVTRDGREHAVESAVRVVRDAEGHDQGLLAVIRDISARKAVEVARDEALALLDTLLAQAPVGFAFLDQELRYRRVNAQLAEINGVPVEAHLGRTVREVVPELAETAEPIFQRVLATCEPYLGLELHGETAAAPGSQRHWLESLYPVCMADGQILGIGVIIVEITERKRAEDALRESELRFRRFAETIGDIFWMSDPGKGKLLYISPAYEQISGRSSQALYTNFRVWLDAIHPDDRTRVERAFFTEIYAGSYDEEFRFIRDDGSIRWIRDRGFPLYDDSGALVCAAGIAEDITERKEAEEERMQLLAQAQAARAEAEEAVRVREAFLSVAAHELKNPLTALLGQAQLFHRRMLKTESTSARDQRTIESIIDQGWRMKDLIDTLLDVSRIERGQLVIERQPVNICTLARQVVQTLQPTLVAHTLHEQIPDKPLLVNGDAMRLEQVFHNLLGNAIKYTPDGGAISLHVTAQDDQICLYVMDEGIGIPADALPHLFRRFYRANNAISHSASGFGVGLYVVKEIVTLHGGRITVESVEGQGSSFHVYLPVERQK